MERSKPSIQWQGGSSHPVTAGGITVTPVSQALILRGNHLGFVWNRPTAVLVEQSGQTRRIPILDITRILQWILLTASAVCWLSFLLVRRQRSKDVE